MSDKDHLHRQLVQLGDMIGDGLADEPGGAWIRREYRAVCRRLGIAMPRRRRRTDPAEVNAHMARRIAAVKCPACAGVFKQTRSGSCRAICQGCGAKYRLLGVRRRG